MAAAREDLSTAKRPPLAGLVLTPPRPPVTNQRQLENYAQYGPHQAPPQLPQPPVQQPPLPAPAPAPAPAPVQQQQPAYQPQRPITPVGPPAAAYDPAQAAIAQTKQATSPMSVMLDAGDLQAKIAASLAANPQGTFGPSPQVDYPKQGELGEAPAGAADPVQTSLAANPQSAGLGPSPNVDYGYGIPEQELTPEQIQEASRKRAASLYDADPELLRFLGDKPGRIGKAKTQMTEALRQLVLRLGDKDLARSLLGDDPILGAISADPDSSTSELASLARNYRDLTRGVEEQLNQEGLHYSGHRQGRVLPGLANDQLRDQAALVGSAQEKIGGLNRGLLDFENAVTGEELTAREGAYGRSLEEALKYNYGAAAGKKPTTTTPTPTGPTGPVAPATPAAFPESRPSFNIPSGISPLADLSPETIAALINTAKPKPKAKPTSPALLFK